MHVLDVNRTYVHVVMYSDAVDLPELHAVFGEPMGEPEREPRTDLISTSGTYSSA